MSGGDQSETETKCLHTLVKAEMKSLPTQVHAQCIGCPEKVVLTFDPKKTPLHDDWHMGSYHNDTKRTQIYYELRISREES